MTGEDFTYTDDNGQSLGVGAINLISQLDEQLVKAEINELNARADLFRAGVRLLAKYDVVLDTMLKTMSDNLEM